MSDYMTETDRITIIKTAKQWVECGGDREGFFNCVQAIADEIIEQKLKKTQKEIIDAVLEDWR